MILKDHCICRRVEWQWSYTGSAAFGTAVCCDCRNALRYTNVPGFVDMIIRNKLTYMATPFEFVSALGHEKRARERRSASI